MSRRWMASRPCAEPDVHAAPRHLHVDGVVLILRALAPVLVENRDTPRRLRGKRLTFRRSPMTCTPAPATHSRDPGGSFNDVRELAGADSPPPPRRAGDHWASATPQRSWPPRGDRDRVRDHEPVRCQKGAVSPTASRIAWRSGIVRRRQFGSRRSPYHVRASFQSRTRSTPAPGVIWRCSHQAKTSSSDRKRRIVAQVKPMSRHQSRAETAK